MNMILRKASQLFGLIILNFFALQAHAVLQIDIVKNKAEPIPILVTNFSQSRLFDITETIKNNLSRNQDFAVQTDSQINLGNYSNFYNEIGAKAVDAIVVGNITALPNGEYRISYQLIDFYLRRPIAQNSWNASVEMSTNIAHKISDEIYLALLGYKGDFSSKIAYVTHRRSLSGQDSYTLEIADSTGRNSRTALRSNKPILSPTWSKDGTKIAYVSFETGRSRIYIQDVYTQRKRFLLPDFGGVAGAPAFSNDGTKLAVALSFRGNQDIYLYDLRTGGIERVTNHPNIDTEPVFSPDGRFIYFTSDRSKVPQVYRVNLIDKSVQRVSFSGRNNSSVAISKDNQIALVEGNFGTYHISLLNPDGKGATQISKGPNDESPSFSPNGKMIIYAGNQGGQGILSTISLTTGLQNNLVLRDGAIREPAWGP